MVKLQLALTISLMASISIVTSNLTTLDDATAFYPTTSQTLPSEMPTLTFDGTSVAGALQNQTANTTESVLEAAAKLWPYRIGAYIHLYWLPIVVVVGSVGNILSFSVMMQAHNRRISCCVYMASLALSDTMMLIIAMHYWLVTGVARTMYNIECIVLATLFQMFSLTGILIVLSMTFDRFLAIRYPLKSTTMCTPRRARITSFIILVFSVAYSVPYVFISGLANPVTCLAVKSKSTFALAYSWMNTVINSLVPFIGLLTMNTFIIKTIKSRGKYFAKESAQDGKGSEKKDGNKDAQLTAMLLLVTFVLLSLTLPQYIRYTVAVFINYTSSPQAYSNFMLCVQISNKLYFTNNGINFFLYCIGGSKFRQDLRKLCGVGKDAEAQKKRALALSNSSSAHMGSTSTMASTMTDKKG